MKIIKISLISVFTILITVIFLSGCSKSVENYRKDITYKERVTYTPYQPTDEEIKNVERINKALDTGEDRSELIKELDFENKLYNLDEMIAIAQKDGIDGYKNKIMYSVLAWRSRSEIKDIEDAKTSLEVANKLFQMKNGTADGSMSECIALYLKVINYYNINTNNISYEDKQLLLGEFNKMVTSDQLKENIYNAYDAQFYYEKEFYKAEYVLGHEKHDFAVKSKTDAYTSEINFNIDINKLLEDMEKYYLGEEIDTTWYLKNNSALMPLWRKSDADAKINSFLDKLRSAN